MSFPWITPSLFVVAFGLGWWAGRSQIKRWTDQSLLEKSFNASKWVLSVIIFCILFTGIIALLFGRLGYFLSPPKTTRTSDLYMAIYILSVAGIFSVKMTNFAERVGKNRRLVK